MLNILTLVSRYITVNDFHCNITIPCETEKMGSILYLLASVSGHCGAMIFPPRYNSQLGILLRESLVVTLTCPLRHLPIKPSEGKAGRENERMKKEGRSKRGERR